MTETGHLIDRISANPEISSIPLKGLYMSALVGGSLIVGVVGLWIFGLAGSPVRPAYLSLLVEPLIAAKQIIPVLITAAALPLAIVLARPEAKLSGNVLPLVASLLILPVMMIASLWPFSGDEMRRIIVGDGFMNCLTTILLLAVLLILVQVAVLRSGAVTKPATAGCMVGLAAGGIAATIYAFICTEDSPGFYGLWYSAGILLSGMAGAIAGKLGLRW
jgi:hypothetical protein